MKRCINLWLSILCVTVILAACGGGASELPQQQGQASNLRTQTVLLPGHDNPTEVAFEVQDGYAIFQGDINLGKVDEDGFLIQDGLSEVGTVDAQAVVVDGSEDYRWPGGVIPYTISGDWGSNQEKMVNVVQQAMDHWETQTLIRFVPRTRQQAYLDITRTDGTCFGTIGLGYYDDSVMGIGKSCERVGSLIHELGHVVGLWHEQSRADRDSYVDVREENIQPGLEHAFKIHVEDGKDVGPYDYRSIMHYPKDAYAIASDSCNGYSNVPPNPPQDLSKCTIVTLNPADLGKIGHKKELSKLDAAAVNQMYPFDFRDALKTGDFDCGGAAACKLADVNSDGMDDVIKFVRNSQTSAAQGDVYVAKSNAGKWNSPSKWHEYPSGTNISAVKPPRSATWATSTTTVRMTSSPSITVPGAA